MLDDYLGGCVGALIAAVLLAATGSLFEETPRKAEPTLDVVTLPTVVVTGQRTRDGDKVAEAR